MTKNNEESGIKFVLNIFFFLGIIIGATLISVYDEYNQPDPRIDVDCGRGVVYDCEGYCYDEFSNSFVRFEETSQGLLIHVENVDEKQYDAQNKIPGYKIQRYYYEDGYYYADIDDIQQK